MDSTLVSYVHDGCASGFIEQSSRVTGASGEGENGLVQAKVFVRFRRNLVVAAGGLQQEKAVSLW